MTDQRVARTARTARAVAVALGFWFAVAVAVSASGLFYRVPAPVVGITNVTLVSLTLLAVFFVRPLRAWVRSLPLRWLVLYHAVRFVGVAFLVLHAGGSLPGDFALVAGWGDIAVAVSALAVAFVAVPVTSRARWWVVLAWNVFGLVDILNVLRGAIQLGLAEPDQVAVMTAFPMSLLPTFVVPLVIVTHVLIFVRLWQLNTDPAPQYAA